MLFKTTTALERLAAHSAVFAVLYMGLTELLALFARLLPPTLRPAHAWVEKEESWDLDCRRKPGELRGNRRVARQDRRRNTAFSPRGFGAVKHQDRRVMARGRRVSDWRYSLYVGE